jgi:spoIIIJ-associated protein
MTMHTDDIQDEDDRAARDEQSPEDGAAGNGAPAADPAEVESLARTILGGLGLDLEVSARDTGATIELDISGPDRDFLLDRKGEALNALQYLINRVIYRGRAGRKIHLDSEGYRRMREDEIVEIARRMAEQVVARGEESLLHPLNPYERRLVHLAMAEIEGVGTRSVGDGFLKRVAIFPTRKRGPGSGRPEA